MNKEVKKLVKNAETIVLFTENGMSIKGDIGSILSVLSMMFRWMREELGVNKKMLEIIIDLAFKTEEEIDKALEEVLQMVKDNSKEEGE